MATRMLTVASTRGAQCDETADWVVWSKVIAHLDINCVIALSTLVSQKCIGE